MKVANVDVGVLMEAKLTKDIYTHRGSRQGTTCNTYTTRVRARKHERQTPPRQYFTLQVEYARMKEAHTGQTILTVVRIFKRTRDRYGTANIFLIFYSNRGRHSV